MRRRKPDGFWIGPHDKAAFRHRVARHRRRGMDPGYDILRFARRSFQDDEQGERCPRNWELMVGVTGIEPVTPTMSTLGSSISVGFPAFPKIS